MNLTPVTREYFEALGRATSDSSWARAIRLMLKARSPQARERAARVVARSTYPWLHSALLRTTRAFVIEDSGYKENVIPSSAHVHVNCRGIPGGQKPRDFLAQVRQIMRDRGVKVEIAAPEGTSEKEYLDQLDEKWATEPADIETPLYEAIAAAAKQTYPSAVFTPALFEAGTSLEPWRKEGIPGYGVYPYVINNEQLIGMHGVYPYVINNEQLIGMHGNDERSRRDSRATSRRGSTAQQAARRIVIDGDLRRPRGMTG